MQLEIQTTAAADLYPAIAKAASRGLHDAAQPLTVLQGLLELTLMQAQTVGEFRESLTSALDEMARLTTCFENLRQLVRLQQPAADVCEFSLLQAVHTVLKELQSGARNVTVASNSAESDAVHGSYSRVRQTLGLLVSAIALNDGGKMEISIEPQDKTVAVRIIERRMADFAALNLEMARLMAASAGAEISVAETPVSISLLLTRALEPQTTGEKGILNHV